MKAGDLAARITIERATRDLSALGDAAPSWAPLVSNRAASMRSLHGDEKFQHPQVVAREQVEFTVRWSENVSDIAPTDRVVLAASIDRPSQVYDIVAAYEVGRGVGLRLIATRHTDTQPPGGG